MASEYARAVTRRALCQILEDQGFTHVESGCLDVLEEVLQQYVKAGAVNAKQLAELSGRSRVSSADLREALSRNVATFAQAPAEALGEADENVETSAWFMDEIPEFPQRVVSGPSEYLQLSTEELKERRSRRGAHIPEFLPPFPPKFASETKAGAAPPTSGDATAADDDAREAAVVALLELTDQIRTAAVSFKGEYKEESLAVGHSSTLAPVQEPAEMLVSRGDQSTQVARSISSVNVLQEPRAASSARATHEAVRHDVLLPPPYHTTTVPPRVEHASLPSNGPNPAASKEVVTTEARSAGVTPPPGPQVRTEQHVTVSAAPAVLEVGTAQQRSDSSGMPPPPLKRGRTLKIAPTKP